MGKSPRSVEDVVEDLGFGQVQLLHLILAHGIWFCEGSQINMAMVLTSATSKELQLTSAERASLSSLIFLGLTVGSLLGGYLSDKYGRLRPLILCYALASLSQLLMSASSSYLVLAVLRLIMGLGHGLGMPTSLAFVSETSPASRRILLQGLRTLMFASGVIFTACICIADDPSTIEGLHWRTQLWVGACPIVLLGVFAKFLLRESPVFLAQAGRHDAAKESLTYMRRLNGLDGEGRSGAWVDIDYYAPQEAQISGDPAAGGGGSKVLKTVFGRHLFWVTVALAVGSFVSNFLLYGHMYAFPKVIILVKSTIKPGYQGLMQALVGVPLNLGIMTLAMLIGCRSTLGVAMVIGIAGPLILDWTCSIQNRTEFQELFYLASQNFPNIAAGCGFLACFQLSVELYPVFAAATSAAVCVATGRIASMLVPFLYEALGNWQLFYRLMAMLSGVSLVLTVAAVWGYRGDRSEAAALLTEDKA